MSARAMATMRIIAWGNEPRLGRRRSGVEIQCSARLGHSVRRTGQEQASRLLHQDLKACSEWSQAQWESVGTGPRYPRDESRCPRTPLDPTAQVCCDQAPLEGANSARINLPKSHVL